LVSKLVTKIVFIMNWYPNWSLTLATNVLATKRIDL